MPKPLTTSRALLLASFLALGAASSQAQATPVATPSGYDPVLAKSVGADERGMRGYVLVILKTGPKPMAAGKERDEMFAGHFANIKRLSAEGKLVLAGPFDGVDGWRGLFIFATTEVEEARQLVATDPVIATGEMVAEFHKYYGSAALMLMRDLYEKVAQRPM